MRYLSFIFFLGLLLLGNSCQQITENDKITIAAAANLQFAIKDLTQAFTQKTGIECELIISSSGKLTAQIKEGAPYDILLSADMKYPEALFKSGLTLESPAIYALGQLVLWTNKEGIEPEIDLLSSDKISHIAMANPRTAPYGKAAKEVLELYQLYDRLEDKLVFGESIAQTNQFIVSQSAEIGFTAKSVVLAKSVQGKGKWYPLDPKLYQPIKQGVVLLKKENMKVDEVKSFHSFLFSAEAQGILKDFGYLTYE